MILYTCKIKGGGSPLGEREGKIPPPKFLVFIYLVLVAKFWKFGCSFQHRSPQIENCGAIPIKGPRVIKGVLYIKEVVR